MTQKVVMQKVIGLVEATDGPAIPGDMLENAATWLEDNLPKFISMEGELDLYIALCLAEGVLRSALDLPIVGHLADPEAACLHAADSAAKYRAFVDADVRKARA